VSGHVMFLQVVRSAQFSLFLGVEDRGESPPATVLRSSLAGGISEPAPMAWFRRCRRMALQVEWQLKVLQQ